jgi:hypothetical protein
MLVAIHQPNYLPWLGYFHKIAKADVFVFLDDVQFSKGSYTNRVQVLSPAGPKWLTVPIRLHLGLAINQVAFASPDWQRAHAESLRGYYLRAPAFAEVWPIVGELLRNVPAGDLATANCWLVSQLALRLGLSCEFRRSSELGLSSASDDRLIDIVAAVGEDATYYSGRGAANYQDPEKFSAAGLGFAYSAYRPPVYPQFNSDSHLPGLSIADALFNIGWDATAQCLRGDNG